MCESHFLIVTYCDAAPHYLPRRKARIRGQNFYPTPMLILVRAQAEKKGSGQAPCMGWSLPDIASALASVNNVCFYSIMALKSEGSANVAAVQLIAPPEITIAEVVKPSIV